MNRISQTVMTLALVAAGGAALGSCNIVGPAAYLIGGQPKVDAQYALSDRPTVVFVDDPKNLLPDRSLRRLIGDKVSQELMVRKLVTTTISPADALAVAGRERFGEQMPIDAIGRAVGAEQVVFIDMVSFSLSPDNVTPRPVGACQVKVIDVTNRERLFPTADGGFRGSLGYPVQVAMRQVSLERYRTTSSRRSMREQLATEIADQITKVFYRHVPDELGSHLNPPR